MLRLGARGCSRHAHLSMTPHLRLSSYSSSAKWSEKERRREFLEELAAEHGVKEQRDWRRVSTKAVTEKKGGGGLLQAYSGSLFAALRDTYPEKEWDVTLCRPKMPNGFWEVAENRRRFMERLAERKGVKEVGDWRTVSKEDVIEEGGAGLLLRYSGSIFQLLVDVFPEKDIDPFVVRQKAGQGHWDSDAHCRKFLEDVAERKGVDVVEVRRKDVIEQGGGSVLRRWGGSLREALVSLYPEREEEIEAKAKRKKRKASDTAIRGHWDSMEVRRKFLDEVAVAYGVRKASEWRRVTTGDVTEMGGSGLLKRYNNSLFAALQDVYGEEGGEEGEWDVLRCRPNVPSAYWEEESNVRRFLEMVKKEMKIESVEDWCRVGNEQLRSFNGAGLLRSMSLPQALRLAYPKTKWPAAEWTNAAGKKSSQRQLTVTLANLFSAKEKKQTAAA